jgi:hypothetical protein
MNNPNQIPILHSDEVAETLRRSAEVQEVIALTRLAHPIFLSDMLIKENQDIFEQQILSNQETNGAINISTTTIPPITHGRLINRLNEFARSEQPYFMEREMRAEKHFADSNLPLPDQNEIDKIAYTGLISEYLHTFEITDRPLALDWIYLVAALGFNGKNSAVNFTESLKFLMFPIEGENIENFQLRMNLLQFIRQKTTIAGQQDMQPWLENLKLLSTIAADSKLSEQVAPGASAYYRLKANESGTSLGDTFGITLEVDSLNEVLTKYNLDPIALNATSARNLTDSHIRSERKPQEIEFMLGANRVKVIEAYTSSIRSAHGRAGIGGYDHVTLIGNVESNGKSIPLEIQITEKGIFSYQINTEYELQTLIRDPLQPQLETPNTVEVPNETARFISRIPWKRINNTEVVETILYEILTLAEVKSSNPENYVTQQKLMYELARRQTDIMRLGIESVSELADFALQNNDIISQLNLFARYNFFISRRDVFLYVTRFGSTQNPDFSRVFKAFFPEFEDIKSLYAHIEKAQTLAKSRTEI